MAKTNERKMKVLATNKKARKNFEILEKIEAGIVLTGPETKSAKEGAVDLSASFAKFLKGELYLVGAKISPYKFASIENYDPERSRKLLLKKSELKRLLGKLQEKGLTLIPLKLYAKKGWIKVELGLAKGKKKFEKREILKQKAIKREIERELKKYQ